MADEDWSLTLYSTIDDFFTQTKDLLFQHEEENSFLIGLTNNCKGSSPLFFNPIMISAARTTSKREQSTTPTSFVAFQCFDKNNGSIYPFTVSKMVEDSSSDTQHQRTTLMKKLATFLSERNMIDAIDEINGPSEESTCLVEQLHLLFPEKRHFKAKMDQCCYKLTQESYSPVPTNGFKVRKALPNDLELVVQWFHGLKQAFYAQSEPNQKDMETHRTMADYHIKHGNIFFLVADNPDQEQKCLSLVNIGREINHGVHITGVYTPPDCRRHGYASILLSLLIREEIFERRSKKYVCLFTDLSSPTPNRIYQEIGFRPFYHCKLYEHESQAR